MLNNHKSPFASPVEVSSATYMRGCSNNSVTLAVLQSARIAVIPPIMITKTIVILVCGALIAPVAFAQTRSTHKRQTTTATEQPITVTGTIITTEEGSAANYQPVKTLVVREDRSNTPGSYVLNGPGHVVNKNGEVIRTAIKPGTHVRVYYAQMGDLRMVDHVVVD